MSSKYIIRHYVPNLLLIAFFAGGCSTKTSSLTYSQTELKLVPSTSYPKLLSSKDTNLKVEVNAKNLDGTATVKKLDGEKNIVVTDKRGQETKLPINDIIQIERIRQTNIQPVSGNVSEVIAETAIYAPLIPVTLPMWPVLHMSGLDAQQNAKDNEKARLVYEGMSEEELIKFIGIPKEKYFCEAKGQLTAHEVWVYDEEKVLRGGRALFIDSLSDKVYHNSFHTTFFKNDCSLITH